MHVMNALINGKYVKQILQSIADFAEYCKMQKDKFWTWWKV